MLRNSPVLHLQVQSVEHANLNGVPAVGLERFSVSIASQCGIRNSDCGIKTNAVLYSAFRVPHSALFKA